MRMVKITGQAYAQWANGASTETSEPHRFPAVMRSRHRSIPACRPSWTRRWPKGIPWGQATHRMRARYGEGNWDGWSASGIARYSARAKCYSLFRAAATSASLERAPNGDLQPLYPGSKHPRSFQRERRQGHLFTHLLAARCIAHPPYQRNQCTRLTLAPRRASFSSIRS